jgi:hypothetical protein
MSEHNIIHPHSLTKTASGIFVPHNLIRFDPKTRKFLDCETGEEIIVSSSDVRKVYAVWVIQKKTVFLVDGTEIDSAQISCDPATGACVDRTTNQPVELRPNQLDVVYYDCLIFFGLDYVSKLTETQMKTNRGKRVRVKKVDKDFWNGPFYGIDCDKRYQIQSVNFDELILSKVVSGEDRGDYYLLYSKNPKTYSLSFGSTELFIIVSSIEE